MTIRLLRPFEAYPSNSIVTLDRATEAALVGQVAATFSLAGGVPFTQPQPYQYAPAIRSAESFGASPSAPAQVNGNAIQSAINQGGTVTLTTPGVYSLGSDSFTYPANTSLETAPGVLFSINGVVGVPSSLSAILAGVAPDDENIPTNTVLLLGDSMIERTFANVVTATGPGTRNANGTTTIPLAATPLSVITQTAVGDVIRLNDSSIPQNNQLAATVTAISTAAPFSITYTNTGRFSPLVGAGNPYVLLERQLSCFGIFAYLRMLAGGNMEVAANAAVGGASVDESFDVFNFLVNQNVYARFGIWCVGRNDIYARNRTYSEVITAAKRYIDAAMKQCKYFIAVTVPAQDSALLGGVWTTEKMQIQLQYEYWVKEYVMTRGGYVVDAAAAASDAVAYRDATSANSNPTAGWTTDGTHPNNLSAYAIGSAILSQIQSLLIPQQRWITGVSSTFANEPSIITDNAVLSGTGGTVTPNAGVITGTAPDSWTIAVDSGTANVTTSQIARTVASDGDAAGNWLRLVITTTGAAQVSIRQNITTARVTNGNVLRAQQWVRLSSSGSPGTGNPSNVIGLTNACRVLTNTSLFNEAQSINGTGVALTEGIGISATRPVPALITPWMRVRTPASVHGTVSSGFTQTLINFGSGVGGATLDIAHPCMKKKVT